MKYVVIIFSRESETCTKWDGGTEIETHHFHGTHQGLKLLMASMPSDLHENTEKWQISKSVALCKLISETLKKEVLKEAIILHVFTMPFHCMPPPLRTNLVALLIWKFPPSFHPPSLSLSLTPAVIRRKQMIPGNNPLINQIQELLSAT